MIDYFHDMSLLKEGDSVNFQKASCTLDGCVKIYTNRVDSVATETGKLLSGLADSSTSKKKGRNDGEEGEESDGEEGDADGEGRRKPKRRVRARPGAVSGKEYSIAHNRNRSNAPQKQPLPRTSLSCKSKGWILSSLSIRSSRRPRQTSTKVAPRASC